MNKAEKARAELLAVDELAERDSPVHRLDPLAKLLVTVLYIAVTVSFEKYDITGLTVMVLFPVFGYQFGLIPVRTCFYKLRAVMPLVCAIGLLNPFFDREILFYAGGVGVSGGVVSMLTLMMKGVFCLMASFLLAATTRIEGLCAALRRLHCPGLLTSLLLLTFRSITILLDEAAVMTAAYHLRAPGQRGVHVSAWGSFLGQLLLRSVDRSQRLYESMLLRGFAGDFRFAEGAAGSAASWIFAALCSALILLFRFCNVSAAIGSAFM